MSLFHGFSAGKTHLTPLPAQFFSELLPEIDHLGELKVTLYAFWFLDQLEGEIRFIQYSDFSSDAALLGALSADADAALTALNEALERAVQRGTLLLAAGAEEPLYFLNTPRGRAAAAALQAGEWTPADIARPEVALTLQRPNIFTLYEQNIGPLTPLIADTLREAEQTYPPEWIEEAIRTAVENNVRRWRYIEAILKSRLESDTHATDRGKSQKDRRRYVQGEYGQHVEH